MTRCPECGRAIEKTKLAQPYRYAESGLKNVYLLGIAIYTCHSCDARFPEIPNMEAMHEKIAECLLSKPFILTGPEFRFLRKQMRMRAKDLALALGVTPTTVSRWETEDENLGVANDRLIRSVYMLWLLKQSKIVDPRRVLERWQSHFNIIKPKHKNVRIELPANVHKPALVGC